MKLDLSELKGELREIYDSKWFPFYVLFGFVLLVGYSADVLWLLPGIGGFLFFLFVRRDG